MNKFLNLALRAACLLAYAMAVAKLAGWLPAGLFDLAPRVAAVLLALHVAELLLFFRHVRLYPGALAVSVLLTLLFGLLHWRPLADRQSPASRQG